MRNRQNYTLWAEIKKASVGHAESLFGVHDLLKTFRIHRPILLAQIKFVLMIVIILNAQLKHLAWLST